MTRQDGTANGMLSGFTFSVSNDGSGWSQVASGTFVYTTSEQYRPFGQTTAQWVKLVATGPDVLGQPWASASEVYIWGNTVQCSGQPFLFFLFRCCCFPVYILLAFAACQSPCVSCSGSVTKCTSYNSTTYLTGNACVSASQCPDGTWANSVAHQCSRMTIIRHWTLRLTMLLLTACSSACQTCHGSASFCTSCPAGRYLSGSSCLRTLSCLVWSIAVLCCPS